MEQQALLQLPRPSPWENEFLPAKKPLISSFDLNTTIKGSMLCSVCRAIQSWLQANWDLVKTTRQESKSFDHCDTGLQLQASFHKGCHLCTIIWHSFDPTSATSFEKRVAQRETAILRVLDAKNLKIAVSNVLFSRPCLRTYMTSSEEGVIRGEDILLKNHALKMDHPLSASAICTSSCATRCLAEKWIRDCTASHTSCKRKRTSSLPGRILHVASNSSADNLHVVDTNSLSRDVEYVALSYCWGNGSQFKLTSHTLNDFISGVNIHRFPKTIRDAVHFTREIGLEWLWVDALCILQDCPDDWDRESSKMCDVYQNSFLTLAALGSSNSDDGLFALRDPLVYLQCELFETMAGETVCASQDYESLRLGLSTWPLHQRRWVMQERILSPRTLNFGPYLIWQCRESSWDEYEILQRGINKRGVDLSRLLFEVTENNKKGLETDSAIVKVWSKILASYSDAALTVQSDSLRAISGVITFIEKHTGWKNIAGLWELFLWRELLWRRTLYNSSSQPTGLGPSWSWISISGGVRQDHTVEPSDFSLLHPISSVKEAEFLKRNDPGRDDHQIPLHVSCVPAGISPAFEFDHTRRARVDLANWPWSGTATYVPDSVLTATIPQLFLPLGAWSSIYGWAIYGLAVVPPIRFPGAWERAGYLSVHCDGSSLLPDEAYTRFREPSLQENLTLV